MEHRSQNLLPKLVVASFSVASLSSSTVGAQGSQATSLWGNIAAKNIRSECFRNGNIHTRRSLAALCLPHATVHSHTHSRKALAFPNHVCALVMLCRRSAQTRVVSGLSLTLQFQAFFCCCSPLSSTVPVGFGVLWACSSAVLFA